MARLADAAGEARALGNLALVAGADPPHAYVAGRAVGVCRLRRFSVAVRLRAEYLFDLVEPFEVGLEDPPAEGAEQSELVFAVRESRLALL